MLSSNKQSLIVVNAKKIHSTQKIIPEINKMINQTITFGTDHFVLNILHKTISSTCRLLLRLVGI